MTMYCIAGLSMMHMLLHVESECDIHDITRGRMWRNNTITNCCCRYDTRSSKFKNNDGALGCNVGTSEGLSLVTTLGNEVLTGEGMLLKT